MAEVLITLGIIGVVAAITMPILISNVNERVNSHRQANIAYKVTQAMDTMQATGLLASSYESTDAFVDQLQKYLKIIKRCDASHLTECWPTQKVTTSDGNEYDVSQAKKGKNLSIESNTTDNVGLVLADGASIILTYNQDTEGIDETDPIIASTKSLPVGFGKSKDFAYTTSSTASIDFVMDINGQKGPNSETIDDRMYDIRSFKVAKFGTGCSGSDVDGVGCVVNLGTSYSCTQGSSYSCDYWEGAKQACSDLGMSLPDKSTLSSIYKNKSDYPELSSLSGSFWSSSEYDTSNAYGVNLSSGTTSYGRKSSQLYVLCVGN